MGLESHLQLTDIALDVLPYGLGGGTNVRKGSELSVTPPAPESLKNEVSPGSKVQRPSGDISFSIPKHGGWGFRRPGGGVSNKDN